MPVDEQKLKNEMQRGGFLSELKEAKIPDSTEMSDRAIEKYEENNPELTSDRVSNSFSEILIELIDIETDIFEVRSANVYPYAMVEFLKREYKSGQVSMSSFGNGDDDRTDFARYPETQKVLHEIEKRFNAYDDFEEAFTEIFPMVYHLIKPITESESQSAGKRAGLGFKNHIEKLVEIAGYEIVEENSRENGYILNLKKPDEPEVNQVYFGFHTTLKDRYRSSFRDAPDHIPSFLATGAGVGAYTEDDTEDVTQEKINSTREEGFKLLALEPVADNYPQDDAIISYEEFINKELPSIF